MPGPPAGGGGVPDLKLAFLDVGQGDGIYIEYPNGTTMLVDMGSTKNKKIVAKSIKEFFANFTKFKTKGQTLDYLILTHGDIDHYNLVIDFLSNFGIRVGNLLFGGDQSDYGKTVGTLRKAMGSGMTLLSDPGSYPALLGTFGGAAVRVVGMNAPSSKSSHAWTKNTSSVVLQIAYGGNKVMLTGDATRDTEAAILTHFARANAVGQLQSHVWKMQHHGSLRTSISPNWAAAVKAEYVIISSDRSGSLGFGEKSTGHRLPQEAALDIVRINTKLATGGTHNYVSSYDPKDYSDYRNPNTGTTGLVDKQASKGWNKTWVTTSTKEGIFTTLQQMDKTFPDGSVADLGVRYDVLMKDNGAIEIFTT